MINESSHDFDPITSDDLVEFHAGLEHDKPTELLAFEDFRRALGDMSYRASSLAGKANPEQVMIIKRLLQQQDKADDVADHAE